MAAHLRLLRGRMRTSSLDRAVRCEPSRRPAARSSQPTDFARHLAGGTSAAGELSWVEAPTGLMALLDVQEQGGEGHAGRRALAARRGADLLDHLESLRADVLTGALPPQRLHALAAVLHEPGGETGEEGLDAILREIELRAEVELAKLARASHMRSAPAAG